MAGSGMDISTLIDLPLWDRARWKGVVFMTQPGAVPVLALVFTNQQSNVWLLPSTTLERGRQLGGDVGEDVVHRRASSRDRGNRDERDQGDEQRVLDQVLAFLITHERTQTSNEIQCKPSTHPVTGSSRGGKREQ
jgi:hypothetical protein